MVDFRLCSSEKYNYYPIRAPIFQRNMMVVLDVTTIRKSEVWNCFLLDKANEVAKCKLCEAKNDIRVLNKVFRETS